MATTDASTAPSVEGRACAVAREIVLRRGGVSEAEAAVLLRIIDRLKRIEAERGEAAAVIAVEAVRRVCLEADEAPQEAD